MFKTVDLFAGAGGLSYGFEKTNEFLIVAAAENNSNARETYIENHKGKRDITMIPDVRGFDFKELSKEKGNIEVVIGGPPCQGFSNANRQKNHIVSMNNSLVKEYFRAIKEINPTAFVMENVAMLKSDTHKFYDSYKDHDEIISLNINMKEDALIISDYDYNGYDMLEILTKCSEEEYKISDELLQMLNVLYKNRNNRTRLTKYINKNSKAIIKKIEDNKSSLLHNATILDIVKNSISKAELNDYFEELGCYIQFQKAFRLKKELDDNEIIYQLYRDEESKKVVAKVNSYTVYEYVNKILGDKYVCKSGVVNSLWFGVPQERKRFIMIGICKEKIGEREIDFPKEESEVIVTVGEAINDLKDYEAYDDVKDNITIPYKKDDEVSEYALKMRANAIGVSNHIIPKTRTKAKERFAALNEGENFHQLSSDLKNNYTDPSRTQNSIYLRLDSSKPSGTVVNVRKSMWVHPSINRAISVREAARLQSFPDEFVFKGTKDSQYQQVGNAVPPLMAEGIARCLLKNIK